MIDEGTPYVLHICHPRGNEMFFGMARNDTPNILIGFGGGNWSQWNLGIIGIRYIFHDNKIDESGFLIGMNTEGHQWWYKDNNKSLPINQTTQDWIGVGQCMVPFGYEIRREKHEKWKKIRGAYHKAKRERAKTAKKKIKFQLTKQKKQNLNVNIITVLRHLTNRMKIYYLHLSIQHGLMIILITKSHFIMTLDVFLMHHP